MLQSTLQQSISKSCKSLKVPNSNQFFVGYELGKLSLIYGSSSVRYLTLSSCIKFHQQKKIEGSDSKIIFVNCENKIYSNLVSRLSRINNIDKNKLAKDVNLVNINSAYEITYFIMNKLNELVNKNKAKVIILSGIIGLFSKERIVEEEAINIFNQIISVLKKIVNEKQIIVMLTDSAETAQKNFELLKIIKQKSDIVVSINQSKYEKDLILEKHPEYILGSTQFFNCNMLSLNNFT